MRRLITALILTAFVASPMGARADVVTCGDPCTVQASINAYIAPVVSIRSGGAVQWVSIDQDVSHPTGETDHEDPCFLFPAHPDRELVPITFTIGGGALSATQPYIGPGPYPVGTNPCTTATGLDDGSFVVQYQCWVHPWMYGAIRVEP